MPHDPELIAETFGWLVKAREDLAVAQHDLEGRPPFLAAAVFHAQQGVEKAFKGFMTWHSKLFRKTHNLEELGEQILQIDNTLRAMVDRAVPLTKYAWKYRYPGEPSEPSAEEAARVLALAHEVYTSILSRLPEEVQP